MSASARLLLGAVLFLTPVAGNADERVLKLYNWAEYIGHTTVADFTAETGVQVVYDIYDNNATAITKLETGGSGYDLIMIAVSAFGQKLISANTVQPVDRAKTPNFSYLDPSILRFFEAYDPGLNYSMPFAWGTTGTAYNETMIKDRLANAPTDSLRMFFDPEVVSKFADCGVSLLDEPVSVVPLALLYLGLDPNSTNPADYEAAAAHLRTIRDYIRNFDSVGYVSALPNRSTCLAMAYNGYFVAADTAAKQSNADVILRYSVPKEGTNIWADAFMIPFDAPNPELAMQFMNFLQRPDVMAKITDRIGFANANAAATPLVNAEIRDNPAIYPAAEDVQRGFWLKPLPPEIERLRLRVFDEFKSGA